jgi:hypothetical protein
MDISTFYMITISLVVCHLWNAAVNYEQQNA